MNIYDIGEGVRVQSNELIFVFARERILTDKQRIQSVQSAYGVESWQSPQLFPYPFFLLPSPPPLPPCPSPIRLPHRSFKL